MEDALQGAKMENRDIDDIVMIGGSTRIPAIQELVKEFFNVEKLNFKLNLLDGDKILRQLPFLSPLTLHLFINTISQSLI